MIAMHHAIFGRRYGETIVINAVACTTFNMTMTYAGGSITVDWGDGTSTTNSAFNKTYASPFTGTIKITGNLDKVTYFQSTSNTGIYIDLKEFWKFTILNNLDLRGNCFINNSVAEIPRVTTTLFFNNLPNLTITGNASDLPRVTSNLTLQSLTNLTMTGNASDLPRVTNTLYLFSLPNLTMTGNISDLPRVTTSLYLQSLPNLTMTGTASDLPRVTNQLYLQNLPNLTMTGNISDLPRVTNQLYLQNLPNLTITGNASDLPRVTNILNFNNLPNLTMTGNISDLPRVTNTLYLISLPNLTMTGNASDLPLSTDVYLISIGATSLTYTALTTKPTTKSRARIEISTKFTTTQTDEMLIDYATYSTTWNAPREIRLSSLGRTTASDAAVATLNSRGVTITLL